MSQLVLSTALDYSPVIKTTAKKQNKKKKQLKKTRHKAEKGDQKAVLLFRRPGQAGEEADEV